MGNIVLETYRVFQLLAEDKSVFGSGYTFGSKVFVTIGAHGREYPLETLSDVLQLPGVGSFQWLPEWADGFDGTEPYSNIPRALAETLTRTERLIYMLLRGHIDNGIHKDHLIKFALGKVADEKQRKYLIFHISNLRKKLIDEGIRCKRGHYQLYKKT